MKIHEYMHTTLGYSKYEIAQINYFISSMISDFSKILLLSIFFFTIHKINLFIPAAFILCLLRACTGGIHFKHYISCLAMSFLIFVTGICFLSYMQITKPLQIILLCICIIINYLCSPVVSVFRPIPDGIKIQRSKQKSFLIIFSFMLLTFILPKNQYIDICFWMIILQSIQLFVAKIYRKVVFFIETYRKKTSDIISG